MSLARLLNVAELKELEQAYRGSIERNAPAMTSVEVECTAVVNEDSG
jgi:hypothetical protein